MKKNNAIKTYANGEFRENPPQTIIGQRSSLKSEQQPAFCLLLSRKENLFIRNHLCIARKEAKLLVDECKAGKKAMKYSEIIESRFWCRLRFPNENRLLVNLKILH